MSSSPKHHPSDQIIPGNALSVDPEKPFHALNKFGTNFLNKFEASQCNAKILQNITYPSTLIVLDFLWHAFVFYDECSSPPGQTSCLFLALADLISTYARTNALSFQSN